MAAPKSKPRFVSAKEAAQMLGITPATLYAYTSRGQLHSEPVPGAYRERRYQTEDVERLRDRKEARRDPSKAAAQGLNWGAPVLPSGITLIEGGKLYYRGRDAVSLARTATIEEAAAILWEAEGTLLFDQPFAFSRTLWTRIRTIAIDPVTRFQCALPLAGIADLAAYDLRPTAVRQSGARILKLLATIAADRLSPSPLHVALQTAWAPENPGARDAIREALVLCADHELNVSAFAARCAASAGASPYDTVSAALATLKGSRHGGATERVRALFSETVRPRTAIANRLRQGESIPGFGHRLYPEGDPRAKRLLQFAEAGGNQSEWRLARGFIAAGRDLLDESANLDFGLVALQRAYGLPDFAPLVLFAIGRTVGWIAHSIEQYESGALIRPRARYIGPNPVDLTESN
jgi:citrate synthase